MIMQHAHSVEQSKVHMGPVDDTIGHLFTDPVLTTLKSGQKRGQIWTKSG